MCLINANQKKAMLLWKQCTFGFLEPNGVCYLPCLVPREWSTDFHQTDLLSLECEVKYVQECFLWTNMPVITTKPDCSIVLIEKVLFTAYSVSPPHNASSSCKVVLVLRYNSAKHSFIFILPHSLLQMLEYRRVMCQCAICN